VLVVGDDDVADGTVGVNARGEPAVRRDVPIGDFQAQLLEEIASHAFTR
jgi:hypothetical protein